MDPVLAVASQTFTKLSIETDGTKEGTTILLNGKAIENLASLSLMIWPRDSYMPVSLGFRVEDRESNPGTLSTSTYYSLIPPKPSDGTATRATASVAVAGSFVLQASKAIPPEHFRPDERANIWKQIGVKTIGA